MQLRMTIKQGVYLKLRKVYGRHVDSIQVLTRPIKGTMRNEYAATCDEHGMICEWTREIAARTDAVKEHLKGNH